MQTANEQSQDTCTTAHQLKSKANFDQIYDQDDPREYYTVLQSLDYELPRHMQHAFGQLVTQWTERNGRPPRIFDVACSYGILASLLRYDDVTFSGLAERYASDPLQRMTPEEVVAADREYFAERLRPDAPSVCGCDIAGNALRYGERTGLLEHGWAINLETEQPDQHLEEILAQTDIVTVSAAIGYVTDRSIESILSRIPLSRTPWFAAFALRTAPIDPVAHALRDLGLELATLTGRTVRQRRFTDDSERDKALAAIRQRGLQTEGVESDGYWHASLYVGHPPGEDPLPMIELFED